MKQPNLAHFIGAFKNGSDLFFFFDSSENQANKTIDASVNKKAADSTSQVRVSLFQIEILITVHRRMDFYQYSLVR